ncbi:hypothetical protein P154DRAFT_568512 [Amniculicola lignicola CBS 123094]|uniref:Uncharacterized protein n=1 Tax=Amniculicola lignicola CBS 123094 TaxID=1392246 RepID=A0A6A5X410_9PLEO|nr:hypothetical protein P154DRAFT_568512 [Amniculicola lignicola CBS 123094]
MGAYFSRLSSPSSPAPQTQTPDQVVAPSSPQTQDPSPLTILNAQTSLLLHLPTELLLEIDAYLVDDGAVCNRVSKKAVRASCRGLRFILPAIGGENVGGKDGKDGKDGRDGKDGKKRANEDRERKHRLIGTREAIKDERERRAYSLMLRRAAWREVCRKEREGELGGKLACCICRGVHERRFFLKKDVGEGGGEEEGEEGERGEPECDAGLDVEGRAMERERAKKTEPESRMCIGSQGVLELCPHMRVTYAGLKIRPVDIICSRQHYTADTLYPGLVRLSQSPSPQPTPQETKINISLRLLSLPTPASTTVRASAIQAIQASSFRICRHMHTSSSTLWMALVPDAPLINNLSHPCGIHCGYGRWCSGRSCSSRWCTSPHPVYPVHRCKAPNCDTSVTLATESVFGLRTAGSLDSRGAHSCHSGEDRDADSASRSTATARRDYLVLRIEKSLGMLDMADDEKWMAQIVPASLLEEDRWKWVVEEETALAQQVTDGRMDVSWEDLGGRGGEPSLGWRARRVPEREQG